LHNPRKFEVVKILRKLRKGALLSLFAKNKIDHEKRTRIRKKGWKITERGGHCPSHDNARLLDRTESNLHLQ